MGNFEILSFGTHQNFMFLGEILTPKNACIYGSFHSPVLKKGGYTGFALSFRNSVILS